MPVETPATKPKVALFDFTSCEGCQLTILDTLQTHPELLDVIDIVEFREAMTGTSESYDIAIIEGSCTRPSDEPRLQDIRERARLAVALGACAHLGGINAIRNQQEPGAVRRYVYAEHAEWYETYAPRPISAVIKVDAIIPGCPIDRKEFVRSVSALLQGRLPRLPEYAVCQECKLRGTICRYMRGEMCLGPISRGGCQAICPAYGFTCVGCRGLLSQPNLVGLQAVMIAHGLSAESAQDRLTMFLTNQTSPVAREALHV